MSHGLSGEKRRTRRAVLRDAKEQLGELLDSVVDAAPAYLAQSLAWPPALPTTRLRNYRHTSGGVLFAVVYGC